jgi:NAD(P)H-dependent flavin oxidoreductase YrpB (nitropropane dioxygenase family)
MIKMKKARLCRLLGIDYPTIQVPLAWITCAKLVAAVTDITNI